jgi:AcrR family transcriptional regulator
MIKILERRAKQLEALTAAAEKAIAAKGLSGLKSRELAAKIGIANGAVFNLVNDMDELVLRVGSRTLARLDIAVAYCDFAADNLELWRALFEHRMAPEKPIPQWAIEEQMNLFRHIYHPLAKLFPKWSADELGITARSLFASVHGMVSLGLEQKLIAVPVAALRDEIATIVKATIKGLN